MNREESLPLKMIQLGSWLLLIALVSCGWLFFGLLMARSILIGGLLANTSFWLLKKDLTGLLQGELPAVKVRFFIKYYARLTVLAVILFLLVRYRMVEILGLLTGLSIVFVSISVVAIVGVKKVLNIREAS